MPGRLTPLTPASPDPITTATPPPLPQAPSGEVPQEAAAWASILFEEHLARWKFEIAEGLRDADGRWIAEPSQRKRFASQPESADHHG